MKGTSPPPRLRSIERHEIERIWTLDRSEVYHHVYRLEGGALVRADFYEDVRGWPPEQIARDTPLLYACFDRGGAFVGAFNDDALVGIAVVDPIPLGPAGDMLLLRYFYVSRSHRGQGVGRALFREAQRIARAGRAGALHLRDPDREYGGLLSRLRRRGHHHTGCRAVRPRAGRHSPDLRGVTDTGAAAPRSPRARGSVRRAASWPGAGGARRPLVRP